MVAAIIAARGGSKKLPRKNVRPFCGVPLFVWAIIQARYSIHVDGIFVSTDDDEIEQIATEAGAEVIRRPDWPDADQVAANRPFLHAIETIENKYGNKYDTILTILPTTPLNLPGDFDNAIEVYRHCGTERVSPLIPKRETVLYKKLSPTKARFEVFDKGYKYLGEGSGWVVTNPNFYRNYVSEISDLDSVLNDMDNWSIRETSYYAQEYWQYADVDTADEFEFAEVVMEHYILKGRGPVVYEEYYENRINQIRHGQFEDHVASLTGNSFQLSLGEI
jgi:N-acylneuraminate cytidylyltransferase